MSSDVKPARRYDSSRRRELAAHTRSAVLEAARRLFLEHGFAGATMSDIASAAGVSVQTVYKAFGNKPGEGKAYGITGRISGISGSPQTFLQHCRLVE